MKAKVYYRETDEEECKMYSRTTPEGSDGYNYGASDGYGRLHW